MKMRVICGLLLVAALTYLSSCSKDSPKPDPIVGVWERDIETISDLPSDFDGYNEYYAPNDNTKNGIFDDESFTVTVNNNKTYSLNIAYSGPDYAETGKWTLAGKNFTLTNDLGATTTIFALVDDVTSSKLVFYRTYTFNLLPNAVTDTLTAWSNTHLSALTPYRKKVDTKVTFHLNKKK